MSYKWKLNNNFIYLIDLIDNLQHFILFYLQLTFGL